MGDETGSVQRSFRLSRTTSDLLDAAAYLDVPTRLVRAAVSYYADHAGEVDADAAWAGTRRG